MERRKKCTFSILGKMERVLIVQYDLSLYLFIQLVKNILIFERYFSKDIPYLVDLLSFFYPS